MFTFGVNQYPVLETQESESTLDKNAWFENIFDLNMKLQNS